MFISDKISLRVNEALPRRSGDGSPFWESGLFFVMPMALSSAVIFVGVDDVNALK